MEDATTQTPEYMENDMGRNREGNRQEGRQRRREEDEQIAGQEREKDQRLTKEESPLDLYRGPGITMVESDAEDDELEAVNREDQNKEHKK